MNRENGIKPLTMAMVGAAVVAMGTSGKAQALSLISTYSGQIGKIDTATGTFSPMSNTNLRLTDIALSNDDQLFGITFRDLYSIKEDGSFSLIGTLGSSNNALEFADNHKLYGAEDSNFYQVDPTTGSKLFIKDIPGFSSSGDLVFEPTTHRFLATSRNGISDALFSIALDGTATQIGDIGFSNVYGLLFDKGKLFGYTDDGQQLLIDPTTGKGIFDKKVQGLSGIITGSTSFESVKSIPEPSSVVGLLSLGVIGASLLRLVQNVS